MSIVTIALSCIVSETARYWSKIAIFHTPLYITLPYEKRVATIYAPDFFHDRARYQTCQVM